MRTTLALLALVVLVSVGGADPADMLRAFPETIAGGSLTRQAQDYDPRTVYDYMDGAADAYLRFDFQRVYTADYHMADRLVVAEVYDMGSSAEAYGIFSTHQRGEAVEVGQGARFEGPMLRAWQDRFFIKIAGDEDSKEFRDFAIQAARHFVEAIGSRGPLPELISFVPEKVLHASQIRYLHTDADLNTAHYVSTDNVLQLAKGRTDVVFANGSLGGKPLKVAVVRYRTLADRAMALAAFSKTILSRRAKSGKDGMRFEEMHKNQFTGVRPFAGPQGEPMLALCFEAKTAALCREALAAVVNRQSGSGSS
jgi:hypothetical protein